MVFEIGGALEALPALIACIRPFSGVDANVALQVSFTGEALLTVRAAEGLDSGVDLDMFVEVSFMCETLAALGADEGITDSMRGFLFRFFCIYYPLLMFILRAVLSRQL